MKYQGHALRHEYKYYLNYDGYLILRDRLRTVVGADPHMPDENGYLISSLYFDDMQFSAMREKISGTRFRKKFRIRCYGRDDSLIRLECKSKFNEYISKEGATLTRAEYDGILRGDYGDLIIRPEQVCRELYAYHSSKLLRPTVVVEYRREAYISPLGNVRITFDKEIAASAGSLDVFEDHFTTVRVLPEDLMVLEVKYDDYLPDHIGSLLRGFCADKCAISKYVMCREEMRKEKFV